MNPKPDNLPVNGADRTGGAIPTRDQALEQLSQIASDPATVVIGDEQHTLRKLQQALRNRQGKFTLLFAVCNEFPLRQRLVQQLKRNLTDQHPVEVRLIGDETSLLDKLLAVPDVPEPLFVYSLEKVLPSSNEEESRKRREATLLELQLGRERFRRLERPLVLWMPEYVYALIGQRAVDFWSWQSGAFFFTELQEMKVTTPYGVEYYEHELIFAREIGDRRAEGEWLNALGLAYRNLGEPRKAIEFYEQALCVYQEIGNRRGEGAVLNNLGNAHAALGELREAIASHEQYLAIARAISDRRGEGNALWNTSLNWDGLGEPEKAIACAEAALEIYEEIESLHAAKVRARLAEWRGQSR